MIDQIDEKFMWIWNFHQIFEGFHNSNKKKLNFSFPFETLPEFWLGYIVDPPKHVKMAIFHNFRVTYKKI